MRGGFSPQAENFGMLAFLDGNLMVLRTCRKRASKMLRKYRFPILPSIKAPYVVVSSFTHHSYQVHSSSAYDDTSMLNHLGLSESGVSGEITPYKPVRELNHVSAHPHT